MTDLPFSKEKQIELLLQRKLFAEVDKLHPNMPNPKQLLTITASDIHAYLKAYPAAAESFFSQAGGGSSCPNWHDVPAVWKDGSAYKVAWLDHGKPADAHAYPALADALTKYISLRYLGG